MLTADELRQKRAEVSQRMTAMREDRDKRKAEWTDEESQAWSTEFDQADKEFDELCREVEIAEKVERGQVNDRHSDNPDVDTAMRNRRIEGEPANQPESRKVFATADRWAGNLKGFDNARDAYVSGRFLRALVNGDDDDRHFCRDNGVQFRALDGGNATKGAVFIPTQMETAIIRLREEYAVFAGQVNTRTMGTDTLTVPRWQSGLTAYPLGDNDTFTESEPKYDQIQLVAKKWGTMTLMSSELSDDSLIDFAQEIANEAAYAHAKKEDECGFIGDGTSTYHGITGVFTKLEQAANAGSVFEVGSGDLAFSDLTLADFETVMGQLPQYAVSGAKWYISRAGYYASMARLLDAAGGNAISDLASGVPMQFLGYPVVISQVLPSATTDLASTVLCAFGNLNLSSTMGRRRGITTRVTTERYIEKDQIGVFTNTRYDIVNHNLGDATNAGPVVGIITPAS